METADHKKIETENSRFGKKGFADFYRFGETGEPPPLIVYVGGAITPDEYEARRSTAPDAVAGEFQKALDDRPTPSINLLVAPSPVLEGEADGTIRSEFLQFVVFDLMGLTPNPRPARMGVVGFSFGAFLGAGLALDLPRARALATLGGAGVAEAVFDSEDRAFEGKRFKAFATANDPFAMDMYKFLHALVKREIDMEPELGEGGHSFDDYRKVGFVKDAFKFVLDSVSD